MLCGNSRTRFSFANGLSVVAGADGPPPWAPGGGNATSRNIASKSGRKSVGVRLVARSYLWGGPVGRRGQRGGGRDPGAPLQRRVAPGSVAPRASRRPFLSVYTGAPVR